MAACRQGGRRREVLVTVPLGPEVGRTLSVKGGAPLHRRMIDLGQATSQLRLLSKKD